MDNALPSSLSARLAALWQEWKQRLTVSREDARLRADLKYQLECLDQAGELDGVLAGIGLARGAVPLLLKNYPGSVRRFATMARRRGVVVQQTPSLKAGIDVLFGPRRRCLFCSAPRRCESWLRTGGGEGYRAFCPNAAVFDRLLADVRAA